MDIPHRYKPNTKISNDALLGSMTMSLRAELHVPGRGSGGSGNAAIKSDASFSLKQYLSRRGIRSLKTVVEMHPPWRQLKQKNSDDPNQAPTSVLSSMQSPSTSVVQHGNVSALCDSSSCSTSVIVGGASNCAGMGWTSTSTQPPANSAAAQM